MARLDAELLQNFIACILKGYKGFAIVVSAVLALVLLDYGGFSFDVLQTRDEVVQKSVLGFSVLVRHGNYCLQCYFCSKY